MERNYEHFGVSTAFKLPAEDGIELPCWKFPRGAIFTGLSAGQRRDKLERLIGQYKTLPAREMSDAHQAAEAVIEDIIKGSRERDPPGAMSKGWSGLC